MEQIPDPDRARPTTRPLVRAARAKNLPPCQHLSTIQLHLVIAPSISLFPQELQDLVHRLAFVILPRFKGKLLGDLNHSHCDLTLRSLIP